jgi:hypothetical protein
MPPAFTPKRRAGPHDLFYFASPQHWPAWPFLPLVREHPDERQQLGVMYDAKGAEGKYGFGSTVFLGNYFEMPPTEDEVLALPKIVYDTFEKLADDGWTVD